MNSLEISPLYVLLFILIILVLVLLATINKLKSSALFRMIEELGRAYRSGDLVSEEEIAKTPKSLSGMDALYLPKVARDFPEFNWQEWKARIEEQVQAQLEGRSGRIYKTVLSRYVKEQGTCAITAETSASYLPQEDAGEKSGRKKSGASPLRKQTVFTTKLLYIQDADKVQGSALGYNCPNCGAPVTMLGVKSCPYCRAAIEPVNIRVWRIAAMQEENV